MFVQVFCNNLCRFYQGLVVWNSLIFSIVVVVNLVVSAADVLQRALSRLIPSMELG